MSLMVEAIYAGAGLKPLTPLHEVPEPEHTKGTSQSRRCLPQNPTRVSSTCSASTGSPGGSRPGDWRPPCIRPLRELDAADGHS